MKDSTRLNICILASSLMVILCVVLWVGNEPEPMSREDQCQIWNKWAEWPEHGDCNE